MHPESTLLSTRLWQCWWGGQGSPNHWPGLEQQLPPKLSRRALGALYIARVSCVCVCACVRVCMCVRVRAYTCALAQTASLTPRCPTHCTTVFCREREREREVFRTCTSKVLTRVVFYFSPPPHPPPPLIVFCSLTTFTVAFEVYIAGSLPGRMSK